MNFFKRLFGIKDNPEFTNESDDELELEPEKAPYDPIKMSQLEDLVKPLMKTCTKIIVAPSSRPPEDSTKMSHFGGQPYFEQGEIWPKSKTGANMGFVFQIYNKPHFQMPQDIKLIQFYYDFEENAWSSEDDGWLVKIYKEVHDENAIRIEQPADLEPSKFCEIAFENVKSLPDWEGLDLHCEEATDLAAEIDDDDPWEVYNEVVLKLTGQDDYQSQLAGYPMWVQGESTPQDKNGKNLDLLFQIDSEDNAGLMWGDVGLIYVFYNPENDTTEFELQCH